MFLVLANKSSTFPLSSFVSTPKNTSTLLLPRRMVVVVLVVSNVSVLLLPPRVVRTLRRKSKRSASYYLLEYSEMSVAVMWLLIDNMLFTYSVPSVYVFHHMTTHSKQLCYVACTTNFTSDTPIATAWKLGEDELLCWKHNLSSWSANKVENKGTDPHTV